MTMYCTSESLLHSSVNPDMVYVVRPAVGTHPFSFTDRDSSSIVLSPGIGQCRFSVVFFDVEARLERTVALSCYEVLASLQ